MDSECLKRIGWALMSLRRSVGASAHQAAAGVGMTPKTYRCMEKGEVRLPLITLSRICQFLGFSLVDLVAVVEAQHHSVPGHLSSVELWQTIKNYLHYESIQCDSYNLRQVVNHHGLQLFSNSYTDHMQLNIPVGELVDGVEVSWSNDRGKEVWGKDIIGKTPDDYFLNPCDHQRLKARVDAVLSGECPMYYEKLLVRMPDSRIAGVGSLGFPRRDKWGRIVGVTAVSVDISAEGKALDH